MSSLGLPVLKAGTPIVGPGGLCGISPEYNFYTQKWEPIEGGRGIEGGCTKGWVCSRLTEVRKRYGV